MAFSMNLWKVDGDDLAEINTATLDKEERLENWITKDPSILGIDFLIIGRCTPLCYQCIILGEKIIIR